MPSEIGHRKLELSGGDRTALLHVARQSIAYGLEYRRPLPVDVQDYAPALRPMRATFVTLHRGMELRGCIGTLEAIHPLVVDVAHHAYSAAFEDPRFPPLTPPELDERLHIHISILSPAESLPCRSEEDLLEKLRPGLDGLILEDSAGLARPRATFLPSVWETLPDRREFLRHLKRKAGLRDDYWSDTLRFCRYTAESLADS